MNSLGTPHHFREPGDEIDLAQLLRHLWRGRWLIAAFTGIAVLVVLACYGAAYLHEERARDRGAVLLS